MPSKGNPFTVRRLSIGSDQAENYGCLYLHFLLFDHFYYFGTYFSSKLTINRNLEWGFVQVSKVHTTQVSYVRCVLSYRRYYSVKRDSIMMAWRGKHRVTPQFSSIGTPRHDFHQPQLCPCQLYPSPCLGNPFCATLPHDIC